ncbi:DNA polymerase III subunit gamma/tau [Candidatus Uhrbacteria bacterium]|nr:DNA polymerase III subunit gamma/tau [Candidatus Uhrbacteria bacterium]
MSLSLYRKYRPLVFGDIAGQAHIKRTLENEIIRNELVHAYLFSGPRAVGKTTTARVFARAINCVNREEASSEPCNACEICTGMLGNHTLDLIEIDAASHTGVDNVRENIIAAARVANMLLRYKVFIIDEVHMLSTSAFNALLKLLEEPPASVVFILATTEIQKVPATIISRCQRFDFRKIPADEMKERLKGIVKKEGKALEEEVYDDVIRYSQGCQRDAESLLGQLLCLHEKKIDVALASLVLPHSNRSLILELLEQMVAKDTKQALASVDAMIEDGVDFEIVSDDVIEYLRYILRIQAGAGDTLSETAKTRAQLEELSREISAEQTIAMIEHFIQAQRDMRSFTLIHLPFEIAVIQSSLR